MKPIIRTDYGKAMAYHRSRYVDMIAYDGPLSDFEGMSPRSEAMLRMEMNGYDKHTIASEFAVGHSRVSQILSIAKRAYRQNGNATS